MAYDGKPPITDVRTEIDSGTPTSEITEQIEAGSPGSQYQVICDGGNIDGN